MDLRHHVADVEGKPLAKTATVPWTAAWLIILVLFLPPTSRLFLSLFNPPPLLLSHAPFCCTPHIRDPHFTPLSTPSSLPCAFIYSPRVSLAGCISVLYANHLCLPFSLFSAPPCLANYFCSLVHSVWGWTRTAPWPPVRGERLSGTKSNIAPFFPLPFHALW